MAGFIDIIEKEFEDLKTRIANKLDLTDTAASGRTKNSLRVEISDQIVTLYAREYFGSVETGRRAGKVPYEFIDIIKQWINDKRIRPREISPYKRKVSEKWQPKYTAEQRAINQMAGAIAYKIKEEGTALYKSGGRNDIYTVEIERTITKLSEEYSKFIRTEIVEQIRNTINGNK